MASMKESEPFWSLRPLDNRVLFDKKKMEAEKGDYSDPSFLFSNFIFSFFRFFVSSFLFFSFVFTELFTWLSHVLSLLSERSTTVLEGLEKETPKSTDKKEAPKASKVEPVKAIQWKEEGKAADKKEAVNAADKKEAVNAADKKEAVNGAVKKEAPKPADKKEAPKATEKKEEKVVMKVPICCGGCADRVRIPLENIKGVNSVECDIPRQKVTVVMTTATPADVLSECVKIFKQSRMWRDDD